MARRDAFPLLTLGSALWLIELQECVPSRGWNMLLFGDLSGEALPSVATAHLAWVPECTLVELTYINLQPEAKSSSPRVYLQTCRWSLLVVSSCVGLVSEHVWQWRLLQGAGLCCGVKSGGILECCVNVDPPPAHLTLLGMLLTSKF